MNITKLKDSPNLENSTIHYMPCKIHYDGEAKIDHYFTWNKDADKGDELTASFRGHPLTGKILALPDDYTGRIFKENRRPNAENMPRHLNATQSFDSIVYWNWDQPPSRADSFISALDWIHLAKAIHEDSEEEKENE